MAWEWSIGAGVNVAGALLVALFGAALFAVRRRTVQATVVGLFSLGFGLATALANLAIVAASETRVAGAFSVAAATFAFGLWPLLITMAWLLPTPLTGSSRRLIALPAVAGAVTIAATALRFGEPGAGAITDDLTLYVICLNVAAGLWWGLLFVLAVRFMAAPDARARQDIPLLSAALVLWPATNNRFLFASDPLLVAISWAAVIGVILFAILWLVAGVRTGAHRTARNVALLALLVALVGAVDGTFGGNIGVRGFGTNGIARVASVAILAYAVLKHHILGLDAKVRFGISRSTVAAAFIAVFFIASEAAQVFFEDTAGGGTDAAYFGILAAGALVFAIAPLSRAADRLAARAVPATAARADPVPAEHEEVYRSMLRIALVDRTVSPDEELHLAELGERLDLPARRALELRREIEAEAGAARPSTRDRPKRPRTRAR